jgi:4-hydroxy-2-oxoheptanedioate aldolase
VHNHLHEVIRDGRLALGAQLRFGSAPVAELFAAAGYDFLVIDGEHAPQTPVGILGQMQAMNGYPCTPVVRFGRNDPDEIRLALDMGAGGVLIPLLKTAADVEAMVQACRYPPEGTRSYGPSRASRYGLDTEYYPRSTPEIVTMFIVETAEAVDNIDEMLAVDGLDSFVMGPADLSIALGVPMQMDHPKLAAATEKVLDAARRAGKPAGVALYPGAPGMEGIVEQGARVVLAGGDEWMLSASCSGVVADAARLRAATGL